MQVTELFETLRRISDKLSDVLESLTCINFIG